MFTLFAWSNSCSCCHKVIKQWKVFILIGIRLHFLWDERFSGLLIWSCVAEVMCVTAVSSLCRLSCESVWMCLGSETFRADEAEFHWTLLAGSVSIPLLFWMLLPDSAHVSGETEVSIRRDGSASVSISTAFSWGGSDSDSLHVWCFELKTAENQISPLHVL